MPTRVDQYVIYTFAHSFIKNINIDRKMEDSDILEKCNDYSQKLCNMIRDENQLAFVFPDEDHAKI